MIKRKTIGPAVLLASAVLAASVPEKPNYSGVWMINPQKSQLANWAKYDQTTITIKHKEPIFRFHRASVKAGKTDESDYELTTDGVEKVNKEGRMTEYNRLYWEGDSLVYSSRMVLPDGRERPIPCATPSCPEGRPSWPRKNSADRLSSTTISGWPIGKPGRQAPPGHGVTRALMTPSR